MQTAHKGMPVERRLAAILAADVVGYSRLMERDEAGTLATLKSRRAEILQPAVSRHRGRIVKLMGDGVLVEFGSAVNAVACAVELQQDELWCAVGEPGFSETGIFGHYAADGGVTGCVSTDADPQRKAARGFASIIARLAPPYTLNRSGLAALPTTACAAVSPSIIDGLVPPRPLPVWKLSPYCRGKPFSTVQRWHQHGRECEEKRTTDDSVWAPGAGRPPPRTLP